jgi:hypothetical protein
MSRVACQREARVRAAMRAESDGLGNPAAASRTCRRKFLLASGFIAHVRTPYDADEADIAPRLVETLVVASAINRSIRWKR